jgi:hypothetical protein
MLPGIDLRLKNMIKSIEAVVLPAIPAAQSLAQEQARLLIGHLSIIKEQWRHAIKFERGSFELMIELAQQLAEHVDQEHANQLQDALAEVENVDKADIDALNGGICSLGAVIDAVILGDDGKKPLSREARLVILDYGAKNALRERTWFQGVGIDPDRGDLPPVAHAAS